MTKNNYLGHGYFCNCQDCGKEPWNWRNDLAVKDGFDKALDAILADVKKQIEEDTNDN